MVSSIWTSITTMPLVVAISSIIPSAFTENSMDISSRIDPAYYTVSQHLSQRLENARFMETTPDFTDLYIIHTKDKGREITIYCSATHCYKRLRSHYPA